MTGIFLQLSWVLPDDYPLNDDVDTYVCRLPASAGSWTLG